MTRTQDLLALSAVSTRLIETNQQIIKKANGTLAGQLLSFIGGASNTKLHRQCVSVCQSLRKNGETNSPVYDQALRRAAGWGRLFELKVLITSMSASELNKQDKSGHAYTALHWAVIAKNVDCAKLLIKAGAALDIQDAKGKTALHYAVKNGDKPIIELLVKAGASLEVADTGGVKPCEEGEPWVPEFIKNCYSYNDHFSPTY